MWLTTADQRSLLARQPDVAFADGDGDGWMQGDDVSVVIVDPTQRFQSMVGFGASFTESAAVLVHDRLAPDARDELMQRLFDPQAGIGLSFLRQPMGASDFALDGFTYDDVPDGARDPSLAAFTLARDDAAAVPLVLEAGRRNPQLTVMGTPWSPPAWMKSSRSLVGGTLDRAAYDSYADYFVRFVRGYAARGIAVGAVTTQNEPHFSPAGYPGMALAPADEADFVGRHLGPAFAAAGIATKILAFDGNWDGVGHALEVLSDPLAGPYLAGAAFHCYAGDPGHQDEVVARHPDKVIWMTECSGGGWSPDFAANLRWGVQTLVIEAVRHGASVVATWNMALDQDSGPTNGGCQDCRGVVRVDTRTGEVGYNVEYYVLGHASAFVRPGAVRIASTTYGSGSVETVAFENTDGTRALIVLNSSGRPETFLVRWAGRTLDYRLAAGSVATFAW